MVTKEWKSPDRPDAWTVVMLCRRRETAVAVWVTEAKVRPHRGLAMVRSEDAPSLSLSRSLLVMLEDSRS